MRTLVLLFASVLVFSQNNRSSELNRIIQKMEDLGKLDPTEAFPVNKLTPTEKAVYLANEKQVIAEDKKKNPTLYSSKSMIKTKAWGVDVRNQDCAWVPMTPPITENVVGTVNESFYADDIASDGNLYAAEDTAKNLCRFNADGSKVLIGNLPSYRRKHQRTFF